MVTERCVNPDTQRPYTMAQIERAMTSTCPSSRTKVTTAAWADMGMRAQQASAALGPDTEFAGTVKVHADTIELKVRVARLPAKLLAAPDAAHITLETKDGTDVMFYLFTALATHEDLLRMSECPNGCFPQEHHLEPR